MNSRRDILKFFGVGAAIVPVIGGAPSMDHAALIVRPPVIEITESPKVLASKPMPSMIHSECRVEVTIPGWGPEPSTRFTFEGRIRELRHSYPRSSYINRQSVTGLGLDGVVWESLSEGYSEITMTVEGPIMLTPL